MNLLELLNKCASDLDDMKEPYLWTDDDLVRYAQYAVNKMCEECRFLVDSSTTSITQITLATGVSLYTLSPLIIEVLEVFPDWGNFPLTKTEVSDLGRHSGWRTLTGQPRGYLLDYQADKLKVYPTPTVTENGYKIDMTVVRYPINYFTTSNMDLQTIEIPVRYHDDIIPGMLSKAYQKKDSETFNDKLATYFDAQFKVRMNEIARKFMLKTKSAQTASPLNAFI